MKYTTRIEYLLELGIIFNHSKHSLENIPSADSIRTIAYFEEGGIEYIPLIDGELQIKILSPERDLSGFNSLKFCLTNLLKKRGISEIPDNPERLVAVRHSIISPDGKDKWDFILPREEDIMRYSGLI
jgi:hypothetical protein